MKRVLSQFSRLQPSSSRFQQLHYFSTNTRASLPTSDLPKTLEPFVSGGKNAAFNRPPPKSDGKKSDFVRHQRFKDEIFRWVDQMSPSPPLPSPLPCFLHLVLNISVGSRFTGETFYSLFTLLRKPLTPKHPGKSRSDCTRFTISGIVWRGRKIVQNQR